MPNRPQPPTCVNAKRAERLVALDGRASIGQIGPPVACAQHTDTLECPPARLRQGGAGPSATSARARAQHDGSPAAPATARPKSSVTASQPRRTRPRFLFSRQAPVCSRTVACLAGHRADAENRAGRFLLLRSARATRRWRPPRPQTTCRPAGDGGAANEAVTKGKVTVRAASLRATGARQRRDRLS
jgi:hypothetical protein